MSALWKRNRTGPKLVTLKDVEAEFEELIENLRRGTRETRPIRSVVTFALKNALKNLTEKAKHKSEL